MADILKIVSIVALSLGIVFLIVAAIIFVKKKIWVVMADLSGKTARASIEQLRSQSGKPAPRKRHSSYVQNSAYLRREKGTGNLNPDKTDRMGRRGSKPTDVLIKNPNKTTQIQQGTTPLPQGTMPLQQGTAPLQQGTAPLQQGTAPLQQGTMPLQQGTMPLQQGTAPLQQGTMPLQQGTMPLQQGTAVLAEGTSVLTEGTTVIGAAQKKSAEFKIITDIVMIHTAERLPVE